MGVFGKISYPQANACDMQQPSANVIFFLPRTTYTKCHLRATKDATAKGST